MGSYRIWCCDHCKATILCNEDYLKLDKFVTVNEIVQCCEKPDIHWAGVEVDGEDNDDEITLPDYQKIPKSPRQSRVELVLQDYKTLGEYP